MTWTDLIGKVNCMDAMDLMKQIPDKSIDLVLTDPPYGINYKGENRPNENKYDNIKNDLKEINYKILIKELQRISKKLIIFGAENFYKDLPHQGRWICWDKRLTEKADKMLGSAFELAWIDTNSGYYKMYRCLHGGVVNADGYNSRFHPTQKPVILFSQIIKDFSKENDLILDPFMGSWTTAIACKKLNRRWIGCDLEEKYCEIGRQRLRQDVMSF